MVDDVRETARRCFACAGACWETLSTWLAEVDPRSDPPTLLMDCAEICELTAHVLIRSSTEGRRFSALCAEICELTAAMAAEHEDLADVVEAARRCARSCRSFADVTTSRSSTHPLAADARIR